MPTAEHQEPVIITQNREQLAYLLTEAAEIEHGLMCCYLFAAYSLKRGSGDGLAADEAAAVDRWRNAIIQVAIDEMLHLALVSNLSNAIGVTPHLERPNFPVAPGYHPAGVVVSLAPFDLSSLDHFVYLERPEGIDAPDGAGFERPAPYERSTRADRLVPSSQDYATVGHLYRGIRAGFEELSERLGEARLFLGNRAAQIDASVAPLSGLVAVVDKSSALRAIDTIVEQGEGSPRNPESSHYRRFIAVREEYKALVAARPGFVPTLPVARNPVMRKPPQPQGKVHIDHPVAARVVDLGNAVYELALRCLARGFAGAGDSPAARRTLIESSLVAMRALGSIAGLLATLPASQSRPGVNAGLTFTMLRSTVGFSQPDAAWALLVERAREIARATRSWCGTVAPFLDSVCRDLVGIADRIELVAPRAASAPTPQPVAAAVVETATPDAEIERVRGEKLVLSFEAHRWQRLT
jgi:hypothetical protein